MTHHHDDHDRDTVVVSDGGTGIGTILGVLAVIVLLLAVWYFAFGPGAGTGETDQGGGTDTQPLPTLEVPQEPASS